MLKEHIKTHRKRLSLTQSELASQLGIKKRGGRLRGRACGTALARALRHGSAFQLQHDELVHGSSGGGSPQVDLQGRRLRVLPVVVDPQDEEERISLVHEKAAAGYTQGHSDTEFISRLPHFRMPFIELSPKRSYRVFQIQGDSMLPVASGSYIMCEYLADWTDILDGACHVVVTRDEGIVYKRLYSDLSEKARCACVRTTLIMRPIPWRRMISRRYWKARGFVSFRLPEPQISDPMHRMGKVLHEIREDVHEIRSRMDGLQA